MARSKGDRASPVQVSSGGPVSAQAASNGVPVDPALQAWLADLGELAGPLAHSFSNFLNVVLLHVAVLEQEGPEALREDLAEIRRQGTEVDAWVKHFQKHRQEQRSPSLRVDINHAVRQAVEDWSAGACNDPQLPRPQLQLELKPGLPPIRGCGADVCRLIRLLLTQAAAAGPGSAIKVRTQAEGSITLCVEDAGPTPAHDQLPHIFEQMVPARTGTSALELAACRSLVRRLEGSIKAVPGHRGGLAILVDLPAAEM